MEKKYTIEEVEELCRDAMLKYTFTGFASNPYNMEEFEEEFEKWKSKKNIS